MLARRRVYNKITGFLFLKSEETFLPLRKLGNWRGKFHFVTKSVERGKLPGK
jgi:hypothetical protein